MGNPDKQGPRPAIDFVIAGMQKSGTTALSTFLDQHPAISMATPKEPHIFDAPAFSPGPTVEELNARYEPFFEDESHQLLQGEATPIYTLLEDIPGELQRFNPNIKVIVLLRDPVERAISHHNMELGRGEDHLPLWLALLLEPVRLRRGGDPRAIGSAMRRHSYRRRGLYARQLDNLMKNIPAERVLLVDTNDLLSRHQPTLQRVFRFLGVDECCEVPPSIVFAGHPARHRLVRMFLRLSFLAEEWRMRRYRRLTELEP